MIGDFLYGLRGHELRSQPVIQRRFTQIVANVAAASVDAEDTTVPTDKVFRVTVVQAQVQGGGAQTTDDVRIVVEDDVGNSLGVIGRVHQAANQFGNLNLTDLDLLLMPGEHLRATGTFSAGAVANLVILTVHGYMLPRGNMQLR